MAIHSINKSKCTENGKTNAIICPSCKKETELVLFKNSDKGAMSKLLGKNPDDDFAVCPLCAAVFEVKKEYIENLEIGTTVTLESGDVSPFERK